MPPKARTPRGKAAAAVEEAPVALPMKRGRAAKADVADAVDVVAEPPKKRGRPAKAQAEKPVEAAPEPKKRGRQAKAAPEPTVEEEAAAVVVAVKKVRGRPKKDAVTVQEEEDAPAKSRGRPKKEAVAEQAPATPKRGRPARAAVDLHRVAGSPRIGKRSSPRNTNKVKSVKPEPLARRLDPRMRSKLRTRLPAKKSEPAPQPAPKPTSRRGRPPKAAAAVAVIAPKQVTKPSKPLAPRKMRGHTVRQIPDRYVAQIDQYLHDLIEADESPTAEEQEDGVVVEVEDVQDALVSSEQDRDQYQEDSDAGIDMNGQQDLVEDEEDMQAVAALQQQERDEYAEDSPEEANDDEFPEELPENDENIEPAHEDVEMSMHDIEMEADADGNTLLTTIDTDIVVRDDSPPLDIEDDVEEEDGLLNPTPPRPSAAAAIFS
ncbi:uncharacterized protein J4E78_001179 [Alternaria triticimaculans]|uniref:uncharacterized protein n=1 Tax=Alternaria triticimaculans TaxID=297637 RepID=UPI0020C387EE|nr:uncharacterized protein J4E78_001179 [Alternaria triticimaculans]KAI4672678.1 hypothetical protein J4E78_001179 [Alternaria triticimaculans]